MIERVNRAKIVNHKLKYSAILWDEDVVTLRLRMNMRVNNEMSKRPRDKQFHQKLKEYEEWLLNLGEGKLPTGKNKKGKSL